MDFPGNSIKKQISENTAASVDEETPRREQRKVKKPFGLALKDVFAIDGRGFVDYLIHEVVFPSAKDIVMVALQDVTKGIVGAIEQKMYPRGKPAGTGYGNRPTNYNAYSRTTRTTASSTTTRRREEPRPTSPPPRRSSNRLEVGVVNTRAEGEDILRDLEMKISEEGYCTVGDYYNFTGIRPVSSDYYWGWVDIEDAYVEHVGRDEYNVRMPRPESLDR